jgi:hypothetical protein
VTLAAPEASTKATRRGVLAGCAATGRVALNLLSIGAMTVEIACCDEAARAADNAAGAGLMLRLAAKRADRPCAGKDPFQNRGIAEWLA